MTMRPTWIIQTNMGRATAIAEVLEAVQCSGALVEQVTPPPFSIDVPDIVVDGPVILYGATSFVLAAHAARRWTPGAFSDADTFAWSRCAAAYGDMLLNSPKSAEQVLVQDFAASPRPDKELVFVRPARDEKGLSGGVWEAGRFRAWCRTAITGEFTGIGPCTSIVIGQPHGIDAEWRLFMAGRQVVTASQYARAGRPAAMRGAPAAILEFGQVAAAQWAPAPMWVLDVCLSGGNPFIVEAQGFNSAGHYAADFGPVVDAANAAAVTAWAGS